jgi:hypothetical protein
MNRKNRAYTVLPALLGGALALAACELDLTDPNNPTETEVVGTISGVLQVAVGLQAEYGNEIVDPIMVSALVGDEVGAGGGTFQWIQQVDVGGTEFDNSTNNSEAPWGGMYDVVQIANVLLESAPEVGMGAATLSGVLALANTYKAMAFGNLLMIFERIPLDVDPTQPSPEFATREAGIERVFTLLAAARQQLQSTPASATFNDEILAPGLDLDELVDAMTARFALAFGRYDEAMAAAGRVDLTSMSHFRFTATDVNPLWNLWVNGGNSTEMRPEDSFRLEAEGGDQRVAFWATEADIQGANVALDAHARYSASEASIPAVFPDEMRLIMAEVQARSGNVAAAIGLINEVREPCSSSLDEPVACLPALDAGDLPDQAAVLDQILKERRYELFALGVRWDDLKRFGKQVKYPVMPVPQSECDRNVNTPSELCRM